MRLSLAALALVSVSTAALGQNSGGPEALVVPEGVQSDGSGPQPVPTYGVTSPTSVALVAHAFRPVDSTGTYAFTIAGGNLAIHRTGGSQWLESALNLPNGSLIDAVAFRVCDTGGSAFASWLNINNKNGGNFTQLEAVTFSGAETPGCVHRTFNFASPIQVDNENNAYGLEVSMGATNDTISLTQARVYYRLQVSPDPPGATFGDVPNGHPFHRYVEALVSSGITAGCGGGNYCPNQAVTRGQMAVFLSVALGLHFPN